MDNKIEILTGVASADIKNVLCALLNDAQDDLYEIDYDRRVALAGFKMNEWRKLDSKFDELEEEITAIEKMIDRRK
tara:strand:- start:42 stop:269 length:228 start_codon:yes stop_codon:yes gene_type:complete